MQNDALIVSLSVLLVISSTGQPASSATALQKKQMKLLKQQQKQLKQEMNQQADQSSDQGRLQSADQARMDNRPADSGSAGDSISMFKAGNTTLPAGTYAMTNVSTGAAFVVIVDDTGDMRAQDARAMKLIDDSKIGSDDNQRGGAGGGNNYGGGNSYSGGYQNNQPPAQSVATPPVLPPQVVPPSAVLPTQASSQHPLLQGAAAQGVPAQGIPGVQQQKQGGIQGLLNQLNPTPGQPGSSGIQGKIQGELRRQLTKQLLKKGGTGGIEQQVRNMIKF